MWTVIHESNQHNLKLRPGPNINYSNSNFAPDKIRLRSSIIGWSLFSYFDLSLPKAPIHHSRFIYRSTSRMAHNVRPFLTSMNPKAKMSSLNAIALRFDSPGAVSLGLMDVGAYSPWFSFPDTLHDNAPKGLLLFSYRAPCRNGAVMCCPVAFLLCSLFLLPVRLMINRQKHSASSLYSFPLCRVLQIFPTQPAAFFLFSKKPKTSLLLPIYYRQCVWANPPWIFLVSIFFLLIIITPHRLEWSVAPPFLGHLELEHWQLRRWDDDPMLSFCFRFLHMEPFPLFPAGGH